MATVPHNEQWLLPMILEYVATRSRANEWHRAGDAKELWGYSAPFMDLVARRNTDCIVPEDMLNAIANGVCTKHVTGGGFMAQPFYNCVDCEMHPRAAATSNLGICASCVKSCHAGHRTFLNSVQVSVRTGRTKKSRCGILSQTLLLLAFNWPLCDDGFGAHSTLVSPEKEPVRQFAFFFVFVFFGSKRCFRILNPMLFFDEFCVHISR
jgi:hypothetical protein